MPIIGAVPLVSLGVLGVRRHLMLRLLARVPVMQRRLMRLARGCPASVFFSAALPLMVALHGNPPTFLSYHALMRARMRRVDTPPKCRVLRLTSHTPPQGVWVTPIIARRSRGARCRGAEVRWHYQFIR